MSDILARSDTTDEGTQAFLPRPNQTIYIFILNKKTAGYKLGKQLCIFQVWVTIWTNQEAGEYLGYHVLVAHRGQNGEYWFLWSSIRWEISNEEYHISTFNLHYPSLYKFCNKYDYCISETDRCITLIWISHIEICLKNMSFWILNLINPL